MIRAATATLPGRALLAAILVALYLVGVLLAIQSIAGPDQVALLWPSTGVALAAVARLGPRWAVIAPAGILLAHASFVPVPTVFIPYSALANLTGAWVAGVLLQRRRLSTGLTLHDGLRLGGVAVAMATISASVGGIGLWQSGMVPAEVLPGAWLRWTLGNLLGAATVAPALLLLAHRLDEISSMQVADMPATTDSLAERHVWNVALAASFVVMAWGTSLAGPYAIGLTSLPLAVATWSALRLSALRTAVCVCLTGLLVASMAGLGQAGLNPPESTLDAAILLLYLCVAAVLPIALSLAVEERRQAMRQMLHRSTTDPLTGLPNRNAFEVAARLALDDPARPPMALAYVDLDHLKVINDTAGHVAGDEVIASTAAAIGRWRQPGDLLGHYGGDDFVILLHDCEEAAARERAEGLLQAIERDYVPFEGQQHLGTTASIGLAVAPGLDPAPLGELLSQADAACYAAKDLGGNRVQVAGRHRSGRWDPGEAMRWTLRIREALAHSGFELYAQSIQSLQQAQHGRHFELLLRMRDRQGVLHGPDRFIPAAERFRMALQIDREVVRLALSWLDANPACAAAVSLCSINLSAHALLDESFIDYVAHELQRIGLPADRLCFEITENAAMRDPAHAQRRIDELRSLGCRFALDDFGTGFCSFGYLRSLDVDFLKIDGSFVRDMLVAPVAAEVVASITRIAHLLGKHTVAEQVETAQLRDALAAAGIDYAQGFAIDRPQPIDLYFADATGTREAGIAAAPEGQGGQVWRRTLDPH